MGAPTESEKEELERLLNSVIHKRKTVPQKCMELHREIVRYEIIQAENAKVKEESDGTQSFWSLVNKLMKLKPKDVSFDDLHGAENKLKELHNQLKVINVYLKKRREYSE